MEFISGVKKKETFEISELFELEEGTSVKVNGAVHTIRDMGDVAFVVLRKREGLLQCVFEEGLTNFSLKDIKEASTLEVEGIVKREDRAPNGVELRLREIKVLSEPAEAMPIPNCKMEIIHFLRNKIKSSSNLFKKYQRKSHL